MPTTRKSYIHEYRDGCADYVISHNLKVAKAAKELGINQKTLSSWVTDRKRLLSGETSETSPTQAELRAAQKRIRELEQENEFLKKVSAFFAAIQR